MKSSSFAKAITLGCLVLVAVPVACGDDTSSTTPTPSSNAGAGGEAVEDGGTGGTGGTNTIVAGAGGAAPLTIPGTSDMASTIKCGGAMCASVQALSTSPLFVDPCCAGAAKDACGLDTQFFAVLNTSFKEQCQAVGQEGPPDTSCPDSPEQMLPFNGSTFHVPGFIGCCRAETGTCGVVLDKVTVRELPLPFASPKLGCVDSTPFLGAAAAAKTCGAGSGGAGGAGSGGASVGGAATGGAGGAP